MQSKKNEVFPVQHPDDKEPYKWATLTIMDTVRVPARLNDEEVFNHYIDRLNVCGGWPAIEVDNFTKLETLRHESQRADILSKRPDWSTKPDPTTFHIDIDKNGDDAKIRLVCMNTGECVIVDACNNESALLTEIRKQLKKLMQITDVGKKEDS